MRFDLVDVFTDRPFAGNALAVVHADRELGDAAMQAVAREFNLSETVFLFPPLKGGHVRVRIFTPAEELPFAGHPTLGSGAVVAWERLGGRTGDVDLRLEERVGTVAVHVAVDDASSAFAWLTAPRTEFGAEVDDVAGAAAALSLAREDVVAPPRRLERPLPFLFVEARDLSAVRRARPRPEHWERLAKGDAHGVVVYCLEAEDSGASAHARMFAPTMGLTEDPATGGTAAPLGALLVSRGQLPVEGGRARFVYEQGYEMGRPSRLHVELIVEGGAVVEARVGGGVARVARGELQALP